MTVTVEPPPVQAPDAGVIEEARARQRRYRGMAGAAMAAAAVIAALLFGFAGGGGGGSGGPHPGNASVPAGRRPSKSARLSPASCAPGHRGALQGAPSRSLLSILHVLRRPAVAVDAGSGIAAQGFTSGVFVHYIRRARVVAGSTYYIYPGIVGGCGTGESPHEGIMELAKHVDLGHGLIGGSGGGGSTAAEIEQGESAGTGPPGSSTSATITMIVPDGVARVRWVFAGHGHPLLNVSIDVKGNIASANVARALNDFPTQTTWYAPDGRPIQTTRGASAP